MTAFSSDLGDGGVDLRVRRMFWIGSALVFAFLVSLILRQAGSYYAPVDGWGVDVFELAMGAICIGRYFEKSWRSSSSRARAFPLVLGAAMLSWAVGDVAITIESLGGASPSTPSVADGFYLGVYPLCFIAFILVIRRGNSRSLVATSLDGLIAGLGVASLTAAYAFSVDPEGRRWRSSCDRHEHGLSSRRPTSSVPGHRRPRHPPQGVPALSHHRQLRPGDPSQSGTASTSCSLTARSATSPTPWRGRSRF